MTDTALILVITIIGWLVNLIAQAIIAYIQADRNDALQNRLKDLEQKFERSREARQYLIPSRLRRLDEISEWIQQGSRLSLETVRITYDFRSHGDNAKRIEQLSEKIAEWASFTDPYRAIALLYEAKSQPDTPTNEGDDDTLPLSLSGTIAAMNNEILGLFAHLRSGRSATSPDHFRKAFLLGEHGLRVVERVVQHIVTTDGLLDLSTSPPAPAVG